MYVGQATKDILEKPRPATPPVLTFLNLNLQVFNLFIFIGC